MMPTDIVAQVLADWTLIGLVVLALLAFAAVVCGLTGYLPSWYLIRRTQDAHMELDAYDGPCHWEFCTSVDAERRRLLEEFSRANPELAAQCIEEEKQRRRLHAITGANTVIWETAEERDRQRLDAVAQIGDRRRP